MSQQNININDKTARTSMKRKDYKWDLGSSNMFLLYCMKGHWIESRVYWIPAIKGKKICLVASKCITKKNLQRYIFVSACIKSCWSWKCMNKIPYYYFIFSTSFIIFRENLIPLKTRRRRLVVLLMISLMTKLSSSFVFDTKIEGLDLYCVMVHACYWIFGEKCQHLHWHITF